MERYTGHIDEMYKRAFKNVQVHADADDWWEINKGVQRVQFFKFNLQKFNVYYGFMIGASFVISVAMGLDYLLSKNENVVDVSQKTVIEQSVMPANTSTREAQLEEQKINATAVENKTGRDVARKHENTKVTLTERPIHLSDNIDNAVLDSAQDNNAGGIVNEQNAENTSANNVVVMKKQVIVRDTVKVYKKRDRR